MFLQAILQLKVLELLLDKIKKDFKIGKLEKEKNKFQTCVKEQLIRGNRARPRYAPPPLQTPPRRSNRREFEDDKDFLPPTHFFEPTSPRETSFLFSDGSL